MDWDTLLPAAIFFDLDGTLCVPTVPFAQVFGGVVEPLLRRQPAPSLETLLQRWITALMAPGPSTTTGCLDRVLTECGVDSADGLAGELATELKQRWAASQALLPAATAVLRRLGAFWPLGLITNGPSDAQRAVVEALGLAPAFRWLLVSGDADLGVRKPDPAIFARAADLAGCPPASLLYVGDSAVNDVGGAAAAGWRTCWLHRPGDPLPETVPRLDLVIGDLSDLPDALARLLAEPRSRG